MESFMLFVKGFVIGIANIIPGVSGGTLAITLGVYEKLIGCISHLFKNFKENIKFLIPLGLGMVISIISMAHLITWAFNNASLPTTTLFMGLVIGGLPLLFNKVKKAKIDFLSIFIFLITFALVMMLAFSDQIFGNDLKSVVLDLNIVNLIKMIFVGVIASATMVTPGVSGSLVLMLLGYYTPVLNCVKNLGNLTSLFNLGCFGIGVLIGIIGIAKLLEWLFKKYEVKTYYGILGFICSSIIAIPISVINAYGMFTFNPFMIIIAIILLILGVFVGYKLGE